MNFLSVHYLNDKFQHWWTQTVIFTQWFLSATKRKNAAIKLQETHFIPLSLKWSEIRVWQLWRHCAVTPSLTSTSVPKHNWTITLKCQQKQCHKHQNSRLHGKTAVGETKTEATERKRLQYRWCAAGFWGQFRNQSNMNISELKIVTEVSWCALHGLAPQ